MFSIIMICNENHKNCVDIVDKINANTPIKDYEMVIVDISEEPIAMELQGKNCKLARLKQEVKNISEAYNYGVRVATRQALMFLDTNYMPLKGSINSLWRHSVDRSRSAIILGAARDKDGSTIKNDEPILVIHEDLFYRMGGFQEGYYSEPDNVFLSRAKVMPEVDVIRCGNATFILRDGTNPVLFEDIEESDNISFRNKCLVPNSLMGREIQDYLRTIELQNAHNNMMQVKCEELEQSLKNSTNDYNCILKRVNELSDQKKEIEDKEYTSRRVIDLLNKEIASLRERLEANAKRTDEVLIKRLNEEKKTFWGKVKDLFKS